MKTILVDDESWALQQLEEGLRQQTNVNIEIKGVFQNPTEALKYAENNPVDFALLDVKMSNMSGIELGRLLRESDPNIIIVYVSSYPEYFSDAYKSVRADYYMLKPYDQEDLEDLMDRVSLLSKRQKKKIQIRTFGRFDVFINEKPVQFKNAKAKELFAICVDRNGGIVKMEEAIDKLWENSPLSENVKAKYRKAVAYLNGLFAEYRVPELFKSGYGQCCIDKEKVNCDYYEFLEATEKPIFFGQYMYDYSWAEETAAKLEMQMQETKYNKF